MKTNILTFLLLILIIAFAVYVYNYPPNPCPECLEQKIKGKEANICLEYRDKPISKMRLPLMIDMISKYKNEQYELINSSIEFEGVGTDSRSVWFDLETLKTFIYHTEYYTKEKDKNVEISQLGLRVYYASYPKYDDDNSWGVYNSDLEGLNKNYQDRHTLIMVPTLNIQGKNKDFNPEDTTTYKKGLDQKVLQYYDPIYGQNDPNSYPTFGLGVKLSSEDREAAQNHGSLIPPGDVEELSFQQ